MQISRVPTLPVVILFVQTVMVPILKTVNFVVLISMVQILMIHRWKSTIRQVDAVVLVTLFETSFIKNKKIMCRSAHYFFLSQQLFNKLVLLLKQIQDNIMSTKALYRKVHIYINGKEIESTIGSLKTALGDLKREQKTMTIGSDEYIKTSLKMKEIESVIKDQERAVKDLGDSWKNVRMKMADISNMIMGL